MSQEPSKLGPLLGIGLVLLGGGLLAWRCTRVKPPPPSAMAKARASDAEPSASAHEHGPRSPEEIAKERKARDAMRAQIIEALKKRGAALPPEEAKAVAPAREKSAAPAPSGSKGTYDPEYIRATFREEMFPMMKACYNSALARRPTLGGKLILKFGITGDPQIGGVVEDAQFAEESDLKDPEMETCVRESLMSLTFDKPPSGGGYVNVTYPVLFAPVDESELDAGSEAAGDAGSDGG